MKQLPSGQLRRCAKISAAQAFQFGTPEASALILQRRNGFATSQGMDTVFASRYPIFQRRSGTI